MNDDVLDFGLKTLNHKLCFIKIIKWYRIG